MKYLSLRTPPIPRKERSMWFVNIVFFIFICGVTFWIGQGRLISIDSIHMECHSCFRIVGLCWVLRSWIACLPVDYLPVSSGCGGLENNEKWNTFFIPLSKPASDNRTERCLTRHITAETCSLHDRITVQLLLQQQQLLLLLLQRKLSHHKQLLPLILLQPLLLPSLSHHHYHHHHYHHPSAPNYRFYIHYYH